MCSKCKDPYFLKVPFNVSCVVCTEKGEFIDQNNKLCYVCDMNCDVCATATTCKKCLPQYYLASNSICLAQKTMILDMGTTNDPQIVSVISNYPWNYVITDKVNQSMQVTISGFTTAEFTYSLKTDNTSETNLKLLLVFYKDVEAGAILTMKIPIENAPNEEYIISNKEISVVLSLYCLSPKTYLICKNHMYFSLKIILLAAGKCVESLSITPVIALTSKDTTLLLQFSNNYGETFLKYKNDSTITIQGFNQTSFNYTISQVTGFTDIFNIFLNYSSSFSNNPVLTLHLNPPSSIQYDQSTTLRLTKTEVSVELADHYELSADTKKLVENTNSATNNLNNVAGGAFAASNVMTTGGSFAFRSLISMDVIRFLRFFMVDYPPNVLAMFQTNLPTTDFIPNVQIEEDERDGSIPAIFASYDLSIYIFNNNGNALVEAGTYLAAGMLILLLLKLFQNTTNRYFKLVLLILRLVFVWNYVLSYFLSTFMNFCLSTFLAYRYPTVNSPSGIFNVFFSVFTGLVLLWIIWLCFNVISKLHGHYELQSSLSNNQMDNASNNVKDGSASKRKVFQSNEPETGILKDEKHFEKNNKGSNISKDFDIQSPISMFSPTINEKSILKRRPQKESSLIVLKEDEPREIVKKPLPLIPILAPLERPFTAKTNMDDLSPKDYFFYPEKSFVKNPKNNLENEKNDSILFFDNGEKKSKFGKNNQQFLDSSFEKRNIEEFKEDKISSFDEKNHKNEISVDNNENPFNLNKHNEDVLEEKKENSKEEEEKEKDKEEEDEEEEEIILEDTKKPQNENKGDENNSSPKFDESNFNQEGSKENLQRISFPKKENRISPQRQSNHSTQPPEEKKPKLIPFIFRKISRSLGLALNSGNPFAVDSKKDKISWFSKLKGKIQGLVEKKKVTPDWRAQSDEITKFTRSLEALNKEFSPLHKDFNHNRALQSYYLMFDLIRQIVFSALVVSLFDFPFTGILVVNIINFMYIAVFLFIRPFKEKIDFIQGIINETCLMLVSLCALILITMERIRIYDLEFKMNIGWVMVASNFFLMGFFLCRIFASLSYMAFLLLKFLFNKIKAKFTKKKNLVSTEKQVEEGKNPKKKSEEGAILQQIIEVENFLR